MYFYDIVFTQLTPSIEQLPTSRSGRKVMTSLFTVLYQAATNFVDDCVHTVFVFRVVKKQKAGRLEKAFILREIDRVEAEQAAVEAKFLAIAEDVARVKYLIQEELLDELELFLFAASTYKDLRTCYVQMVSFARNRAERGDLTVSRSEMYRQYLTNETERLRDLEGTMLGLGMSLD